MVEQTVSQLILLVVTASGAVVASLWLGIVLWTLRDMRVRSRDVLAQGAAALMVAILNIFGLIIYLMLRPRETLAEAYERSLEEEALLQGIEEKPTCPGCGRATDTRWQVCPHCYTRLKKKCIHCEQMLDLSWNLCPYCGTQQSSDEQRGQRTRRNGSRTAEPQENYRTTALEFVEDDET